MVAEVADRLDLLCRDARFDVLEQPRPALGAQSPPQDRMKRAPARPGCRSPADFTRHISVYSHPQGPMPVLAVMQTNACTNDCYYCGLRASRDFRRESISPDELAVVTDRLFRARVIGGLFLSSGVVGRDDYALGRMCATAEILRHRHGFPGYIHVKLMPGASDGAIEAALAVADRVSVNLEAPTAERLARLTPSKDFDRDLVSPLRRVQAMLVDNGRRVSRSSQFVVGPAGESDRELLAASARLYRGLGVSRVYYSAFTPVADTPLASTPAEALARQDRLYQADALLRVYGFELGDIALEPNGKLALDVDPKLHWARTHPESFPVEVNRAGRRQLLRVPGFGVVAADAVLAARRRGRIRSELDLRRLGIRTARALPFITLDGHSPYLQPPLMAASPTARDNLD